MNPTPTTGSSRPQATPGLLITFEGPEGSGKSTQIRQLKASLESAGRKVLLTREPGGTPAGDRMRAILLDRTGDRLEAETELFLMLAQRIEHWRKVIQPAKAEGRIVLCDRYFDSSLAYQGFGRELGLDVVRRLHLEFLGSAFLPDLTLLFDLPPELGLERVRTAGRGAPDRMESEIIGFHKRVREGYLAAAREEPQRFRVLQADRDVAAVFRQMAEILNARFDWNLAPEGVAA